MKFKLVESYKPEYQPYTFDELLDGMNGNVSDEEIDKFIKFYNKVAKLLRRKPEDILAFRSEDELFELLPLESEKVKIVGDEVLLKTYIQQDNVKFIFAIEQFINGNYWYYVRDDKDFFTCFTDDWDKYQNSVQQFNEDISDTSKKGEPKTNINRKIGEVEYSLEPNRKERREYRTVHAKFGDYVEETVYPATDTNGHIICPKDWEKEWY